VVVGSCGGIVEMAVAVASRQSAGDGVGLGQRHVVSFEMLLKTRQLPECLRAALHHAPVRTVTCTVQIRNRFIKQFNAT